MSDRIVSVIGLGLMGGSLGLALKRAGFAGEVRGYARRQETRARALEMGAVDVALDSLDAAVKGADVIVFCTPVSTISDLLSSCLSSLKPGTVVTDVGSTKGELAEAVASVLSGTEIRYVGSHPICGSEKDGLDAARQDLYEGSVTVLSDDSEPLLLELWQAVGSRVVVMSPKAHDAALARTSHAPHLLAALVVASVDEGDAERMPLCGTGFRDATRIAGGPADVWRDIVLSNDQEIAMTLRDYRSRLDSLIDLIESGDAAQIETFLESARAQRLRLLGDDNE